MCREEKRNRQKVRNRKQRDRPLIFLPNVHDKEEGEEECDLRKITNFA